MGSNARPVLVSMGMFIIDEIHFDNGTPTEYNVIGGAGTYTAIGSRVFVPQSPQSTGIIVDVGKDFPDAVKHELDNWNMRVLYRNDPTRLTTRGWNMYGANEERDFKYLTPKLRIEVDDLKSHQWLLDAQSIHAICSPKRLITIVTELRSLSPPNQSLIAWEPVPPECTPENWPACQVALKSTQIFSPNALEGARFFGEPEPTERPAIEALAGRFLDHMGLGGVVAVRCGPAGSLVKTRTQSQWFPAYHEPQNDDYEVVDPTGGGNTYVGGFATGYVLSGGRIDYAGVYGSVAAALAIEQIGLPKLQRGTPELINGRSIADRIERYCQRHDIRLDSK